MLGREDCLVRPMSESDLEMILRWRNSERVRINMFTDHVITRKEHQAWFGRLKERQTALYLVFEFQKRPIGLIYFTDIDPENGKCILGFYLGEEDIPKGMGTMMGVLGLEYAFEKMRIRKLCGEVFSFNKSSINLFLRLGFTEEGCFVKHVLKNGKYEEIVSFALFKDEWEKNREKLEVMVIS